MLEWTVDALKMYYTEILTHGIALLVGMGLGMAITGEIYEKKVYKSHGSDETGEVEQRREVE